MNSNWAKILLFSLIGFALGFLVCRAMCQRGCEKGGNCASASSCEHGGKACCKGGRGEHGEHHGHHGWDGEEKVEGIVKGLEASNFQGDTTIMIDGGTVNVKRTDDKVEVKVELKKKDVEVHTEEVEKVK